MVGILLCLPLRSLLLPLLTHEKEKRAEFWGNGDKASDPSGQPGMLRCPGNTNSIRHGKSHFR
jgi:hypothetical protein